MVQLEQDKAKKVKCDIRTIVGKYIDLNKYKIFIFGSRATAKGSERSDIDVGILGDSAVPKDAFASMRNDLEELATLYKIDLVDFYTVSERFKEVALQHIEYL